MEALSTTILSDENRLPFEPEVVVIPAGAFIMGSSDNDLLAIPREKPQHVVTLPTYAIGRYPVTNDQFAVFVHEAGYCTTAEEYGYGWSWDGVNWMKVEGMTWQHPHGPNSDLRGKGNHPVVVVSWYDAIAYCRWLAQQTGRPYRLPSEGEWEKAARGVDGRIYPWGNTWDVSYCNTQESNIGDTTAVDAYSPGSDSPFGIADMAGNTYDWTSTMWGEGLHKPGFRYPYHPDGRENPDIPAYRLLRGGLFSDLYRYVRCAYRYINAPRIRDRNIGFRVACGESLFLSNDGNTINVPVSLAGTKNETTIKPLQDKIAVITGAGRGIGCGIALELARAGAKVALISRNEANLLIASEEIDDMGGISLVVPTDVSQEDQVQQAFNRISNAFGPIDILVNCAGILHRAPIEEATVDAFSDMVDTNLKGYFLMMREAFRVMTQNNGGYIINIAANVLSRPKLLPNLEGYYATKMGILGLSRSFMTRAEAQNVRVSVIMPGWVYKPGMERQPELQVEISDIAQLITYLTTTSPHVHIREIVLTGQKF